MMDPSQRTDEASLILAAEECPVDQFDDFHAFSAHDDRIIRKLIAHGPVLLQGGRGSGKSALMIAASRRMAPFTNSAASIGLYISLRYVPLLQTTGSDYERLFCGWVSTRIQRALGDESRFPEVSDVRELKSALSRLASRADKRIVLLFDDAAHIGRETSLGGFFDLFRTLSSDVISCKAAIYPGVTEFGTRFDVYNDASLVDVVRSPDQPGFTELFQEIVRKRYPALAHAKFTGFDIRRLAHFLGVTVLGNVRGFIFACNDLLEYSDSAQSIGFNALGETLLRLAAEYYWPLLEEVKPKLGRYVPAVTASEEIAGILFTACSGANADSVLVHRALIARYSKPFEILEYAGFISRREASRALKSGGRGPRFAVNLCNLLECLEVSRLTSKLFEEWSARASRPVEIHERGGHFAKVAVPEPLASGELEVLKKPVSTLRKSAAYPYGLTDLKITALKKAGIKTIGDLASASDADLSSIGGVGEAWVDRFKSVVGQAIWM